MLSPLNAEPQPLFRAMFWSLYLIHSFSEILTLCPSSPPTLAKSTCSSSSSFPIAEPWAPHKTLPLTNGPHQSTKETHGVTAGRSVLQTAPASDLRSGVGRAHLQQHPSPGEGKRAGRVWGKVKCGPLLSLFKNRHQWIESLLQKQCSCGRAQWENCQPAVEGTNLPSKKWAQHPSAQQAS